METSKRNERSRRRGLRGLAAAGSLALTLTGCAANVKATQMSGCPRLQDDRGNMTVVEGAFSLTPAEAKAIAQGGTLDTKAQQVKDQITGDHVDELRFNKVDPVVDPYTETQRQQERVYQATEALTDWARTQEGYHVYTMQAHVSENKVGGLMLSNVCVPAA